MSRKLIAIAMVMAFVACADPDAVTAPDPARDATGLANVVPCTVEQAQQLIDTGQYNAAIQKFTCIIDLDPTGSPGHRKWCPGLTCYLHKDSRHVVCHTWNWSHGNL